MTKKEKKELFTHWLAYQLARKLFKERLTPTEIRNLYHILSLTTVPDIVKRTGRKYKTIKFTRGNIFKKIKDQYKLENRIGKDAISHFIIFETMFSLFSDEFFNEWNQVFREKSHSEPERIYFRRRRKLKEEPEKLPSGVKNF